MINFLIYGNTDYLDVLEIQTDYLASIENKILLINHNDLNLSNIYEKYTKVFFYDGSKPYAHRLIECLSEIDDEYILLCHDIDILFNINEKLISEFHKFLDYHNFDRIDLKHTESINSPIIYKCNNKENYKDWRIVNEVTLDENLYLIKEVNPSNYIYNVNPSIWRKETILEIMKAFPNKNYREIEGMDVQLFSSKYNIYKIFSKEKKECGHFNCINDFVFFHISHNGSFVPLTGYHTVYGQSYLEFKDEYEKIVDKYNLKKSKKWKY